MTSFHHRRRAWMRTGLLLLPLCAGVLVGGCSDDDDGTASAGSGGVGKPAGYEDVELAEGVTDEAFVSLVSALEQGVLQDPAKAATLDAPLEEVPAASVPTFAWHVGGESRLDTRPATRHAAVPPANPWPEPVLLGVEPPAPRAVTALERALQVVLSRVPSAHAHGTPFNGYGTFVTVSSGSDPKLARVFTGASTWTPSADAWQAMVGAGGELTVTLVGADFEQNRIPAGTGVYQGSSTTFTIAP